MNGTDGCLKLIMGLFLKNNACADEPASPRGSLRLANQDHRESFPTALWQDIQTRYHNHMGICPVPKRMGKMHALSQWPTTYLCEIVVYFRRHKTKHVIEFTVSCPFKDKMPEC